MPRRVVRPLLFALTLLLVLPAEGRRRAAGFRPLPPPQDVFSAAEPAAVRTTHLALDLDVNMTTHRISGSATHTITNLTGTNRFVLDTRGLEIIRVTADGVPAQWSSAATTRNGRALTIAIAPSTRQVRIEYRTGLTENALLWIDPLQTIGGVSPFMFTFVQPDGAREWIPIQDTPGVRMTYEATVRVPGGLMALMSARNPTVTSPDGVYRFEMPYPVPAYLIALAVGRVEFHPVGDRTGFYAEPELVADAASDLQYLPEMLAVAEEIFGPYPFDRYDLLLMPAGFPAGGMENPMLNFMSARGTSPGNGEVPPVPPDLVAHELAHSWAGDAVTCATWSDTWLNEGFASYYSKRILEEMVSEERSELGFYWERQSFESYAAAVSDDRFEAMHRTFTSSDSISIFSPTSYSKGAVFLLMLEQRLGRERFDAIMREWFRRHEWSWVDDRAFLELLAEAGVDAEALLLDEWLYGPGLPPNVTAPVRSALWDRIGVEAQRLRSGTPAAELDTAGWGDFEIGLFLWQATDVVASHMAELDAVFDLSAMRTPSMHWLLAVASTFHPPAMPRFEEFLTTGGPNVVALYQRMAEKADSRAWARDFYMKNRLRYDTNTRKNIESVLGLSNSALELAA